jgi:hypothetical protein
MLNKQQEIAQGEAQIEALKERVVERDAVLRLSKNADFIRIFHDDYFLKEAARLVHLSADPVLDDKQRADALAMAQATGHVKRYLSVICQMGDAAESQIPQMHELLDELRAEDTE